MFVEKNGMGRQNCRPMRQRVWRLTNTTYPTKIGLAD